MKFRFLLFLLLGFVQAADPVIRPAGFPYGSGAFPTNGSTPGTTTRVPGTINRTGYSDNPSMWTHFIGGTPKMVQDTNELYSINPKARIEFMTATVKDAGYGTNVPVTYMLLHGIDNTNWFELSRISNNIVIPNGSSSVNIYNSDGTITSPLRTIEGGGNSMVFTNLTSFIVDTDTYASLDSSVLSRIYGANAYVATIDGAALLAQSGGLLTARAPNGLSFQTPNVYAQTATVGQVPTLSNTNGLWEWGTVAGVGGGGAWNVAAGKTGTLNNSLTFNGTDSTTITFPTTSATIARTDNSQTFSGIQTYSNAIRQADGSAATPSYSFTSATSSGLWGGTGNAIYLSLAGANRIAFFSTPTMSLVNSMVFGWASGDPGGSSIDSMLTRKSAANIRQGATDAAAPVAQTSSVQSVVAGTSNTAGAVRTLTDSAGTGTGGSGGYSIKVAPAGSTGTAQNAHVEAIGIASTKKLTASGVMTIDGDGAASLPGLAVTGDIFQFGSATTTKPLLLIEPVGITSTGWDTGGTMFGLNAQNGFFERFIDLQKDGTSRMFFDEDGDQHFGNVGTVNFWSGATAGTTTLAGKLSYSSGFRTDLGSDGLIQWSGTTTAGATIGVQLGRAADGNLRQGAADAASPVAQKSSVQSVVAGTTDTAGANRTFTGSQGTGTGVGGSIIFQTAPAGTTGTTQNALATALTIDSTLTTIPAGPLRLKGYTVATLPATPTQGDTAFVTDATAPTYLATLTGGGAVVCPVFYNGAAWVSH